ncbi:MAG: DHH family phosphoesterase [Candidatus Aenigmarchaeota archaeon]|nr:DHH family phosphoesterase [Candidatus Aenigmarchaeota archaeon]
MEKVVKFLKSVKETDNVIIVFNNDADGMCSCALVDILLRKKLKKETLLISQPMPMDKNLISRIRTTIPDKIIFLDLAADQQEQMVKKIAGLAEVLIIDHHQVHKNMNSRRIVHYNPRFGKKVYQSTSYLAYKICSKNLAYKICSKTVDMSEHLWIAAAGMIGDYNLGDSEELVNEIMKKYGTGKDLYKSFLGRVTEMISASQATKALSCEQIVRIMEKSSLEEMQKNEKLLDAYRKVEDEMARLEEDADINAEKHGHIIFYSFKSKFSLRSEISTKLSGKFHGKTIVIYEKIGGRMKISARNQSGADVASLLKKAAEGLDAMAGGHEAAAGAAVAAKDWDEFKARLVEMGK